jgi:very-short-patch-repair endonuclease
MLEPLLLEITALAARQHGVVSIAQVRRLGASHHAIAHLVATGQWVRVSPMVLRRAGSPRTRSQEIMEAVLDAGAGAAVSHLSAASLWGLNVRPGSLDITRHRNDKVTPPRFARIHEPRFFPEHHRRVLDGIPVTVPARIPFDVAAVLPSQAAKVLDRLWARDLLGHRSAHRMLGELAERGRPGIRLMRTLLAERGPDYRPNDTNLEDRFQELAREAGVHDLVRQRNLLDQEWLGRVDFVWAARRLVIEVQSGLYHEALCDQAADACRREVLEAAGYRVEEFTDTEVWFDPAGTVRRLRALAR